VVLDAAPAELFRRIQSPERVGRKMTDAALLETFFAVDELQRPMVPERLDLDVTALTPDAAAAAIERHVAGLRGSLAPATERHLGMG
jgi:hypothetical protein